MVCVVITSLGVCLNYQRGNGAQLAVEFLTFGSIFAYLDCLSDLF